MSMARKWNLNRETSSMNPHTHQNTTVIDLFSGGWMTSDIDGGKKGVKGGPGTWGW